MIGLILKDLIMLKFYLFVSLFLGVWMLLPSRSQHLSLPGIYMVWIGVWFLLVRTLWASDDSFRCEAVINSLPLSKRDIVCGRHLTSLVFLVFGFVVMMAWFLLLRLLGIPSLIPVPWISVISIGLMISVAMTIITFPIFFKLDYMKARWASLLAFIAAFTILNSCTGQMSAARGLGAIQWMENLGPGPNIQLLGISVLIFSAVTWLSIEISTWIYRSREF